MPDPRRVVGLLTADGGRFAGSGYLIASGLLLTAEHVVDGLGPARLVIGDPSTSTVELLVDSGAAICDRPADLAILAIDPVLGPLAPAPSARLDERSADVVVTALGFPQFSVIAGGERRLHAATGTARPTVNVRGGSLRFEVDSPLGERNAAWGGMSGAVLWAGGRFVGVITEHVAHAGAAALGATLLSAAGDALVDALPRVP